MSQSNSAKIRKNAFLEEPKDVGYIISMTSENKVFIAVHRAWFSNYATKNIRRIYGCNIAEVVEDYSSIKLLGEVQ